jgi:hypothetical protein
MEDANILIAASQETSVRLCAASTVAHGKRHYHTEASVLGGTARVSEGPVWGLHLQLEQHSFSS